MALRRYSGRNMTFYLSVDGTAAPTPVPFLSDYEIVATADNIEVTAGGDTNKTYVPGLPDFSGSISGFFDYDSTAATDSLWKAGRDGVARAFYLYPDANTATLYFYGTAYFDFSHSAGVAGAGTVSSNIVAAGTISRRP